MAAFHAIVRFRGDSRLSTWLYRVSVNVALQWLSRRRRSRELPAGADHDVPVMADERTPARFFNTAAFQLQAAGTFGNTGRNTINGPNYKSLDLALLKSVPLAGEHRLQLRLEVFNALNNVNFLIPNRNFGTPQFGTVTAARDARSMQLGVKYLF